MKNTFLFILRSAVPGTVLKKLFMVFFFAIAVLGARDALATQYFWVEPLPGQIPGGAKKIDASLDTDSRDDVVAIDNNGVAWAYDVKSQTWTQMTESGWKYIHLARTISPDAYYLYLINESGSLFGIKKGSDIEAIPIPIPFSAIAGVYGEYALDNDGKPWVYYDGGWNKITTDSQGDQIAAPVYVWHSGNWFLLITLVHKFYITPSVGDNTFCIHTSDGQWVTQAYPTPEYINPPYHMRAYYAVDWNLYTLCLTEKESGAMYAGMISDNEWRNIALSQQWVDIASIDYDNVYLLATDGTVWHGEVLDDAVPCANRLLGFRMYATGSTLGRNSSGYSACGGYGPDFTHLWTAPRSGTYVFSTMGSNFDTVIYLKTVCNGVAVRCDDDSGGNLTSRLEYTVNKGDKLLIIVDGYGPSSQGNYNLNIAPKGYECVDIDIDAMSNETIGGSTAGTANRVTSSCGGNGPDVTYLWRAPASAKHVFDTQGSEFDTVLSLRSACGGPVLKCDDDSGGNTTSKFEYTVAKNKLYLLTIDGYYATSKGSYNLRIKKK